MNKTNVKFIDYFLEIKYPRKETRNKLYDLKEILLLVILAVIYREGLPKFTINVGTYSLALAEFFLAEFNQEKVKEHPSLGDYHWETRIGSLVLRQHPSRQKDEDWKKFGDKWWDYDDTTNVEQLFNETCLESNRC